MIKATISALFPRPEGSLAAASISDLKLLVTDPLTGHYHDESIDSLRGAHTQDVSVQLGNLLLGALRQRESIVAPLVNLHISSCMCHIPFDAMAESVRSTYCTCSPDHSGWFESDVESDGESD